MINAFLHGLPPNSVGLCHYRARTQDAFVLSVSAARINSAHAMLIGAARLSFQHCCMEIARGTMAFNGHGTLPSGALLYNRISVFSANYWTT